MASEVGIHQGADWTSEENDILVASYFAMLSEELAGRDYVKAKRRREIVARIDRSEGSVERKLMNVSAVLMRLSLPRIKGYAPAWNAQFGALTLAIERRLEADGTWLAPVILPRSPTPGPDPFVPAPIMIARQGARQEPIEKLVRKFDPVGRDARNRALGKQGEAFVVEAEERRLHAAGRTDLSRAVRWVAEVDGDGAGYDVRSFEAATGATKLIEVKTTCGDERTPFYVPPQQGSLVAGAVRSLLPLSAVQLLRPAQNLRTSPSIARGRTHGGDDLDGVVPVRTTDLSRPPHAIQARP